MSSILAYTFVCFGSLFSIVDPFAALPIFLALVGGQPRKVQARTALRATLTCFIVLTTFGVAGSFIFTFFSITIPAFKIAGGILLFGVGLDMMRAKHSDTRSTSEEQAEAEQQGRRGRDPARLAALVGARGHRDGDGARGKSEVVYGANGRLRGWCSW